MHVLHRKWCEKILGASCLALCLLAGCESAADLDAESLRKHVLLDQLPSDVISLAEAQSGLEEGVKIRVVGRIFADKMSPFDPETAAFNLIELPKPGHDHENPGDCPFCKRDMENAATAVVQVLDAEGNVFPQSADRCLQLSKNQDLVIEGTASKVGDLLVLDATSLHLLSDEDSMAFRKRIHKKVDNQEADIEEGDESEHSEG